MKKVLSKILKFIGKIFKAIYAIVDAAIVTPLSKLVYFINDKITTKGGGFDKFINNPNTLIYISLLFAFAAFLAVDRKIITLTEKEATVLSNIPINAEYNEETYVVEGIPESADIVLMGRKSLSLIHI